MRVPPDACPPDLAARYFTGDAGASVGGDFYDVFEVDADRWAVVIGDVTGRGIEAAGTTALARHTVRALSSYQGPDGTLRRLNALLRNPAPARHLLTAAYAHLIRHPQGTFTLTLARAGHPPPLLVHADGTHVALQPPGRLLGAFAEVELPEVTYQLCPGDTLLLYTDGVTETSGADGLFGEDRLAAAASEAARTRPLVPAADNAQRPTADDAGRHTTDAAPDGTPAERTAAAVLAALEAHRSGVVRDDLAILALHIRDDGAR